MKILLKGYNLGGWCYQIKQNTIKYNSIRLHSLAQLHNQMFDIIKDKTMTSNLKLNIFISFQGRSNKIKDVTGILFNKDISTPDDKPITANAFTQTNVNHPN